jgi:hypothetical protein
MAKKEAVADSIESALNRMPQFAYLDEGRASREGLARPRREVARIKNAAPGDVPPAFLPQPPFQLC